MTQPKPIGLSRPISQPDKFRDLARELGCDEEEAAWDERLRQVAGHKPSPEPEEPEQ